MSRLSNDNNNIVRHLLPNNDTDATPSCLMNKYKILKISNLIFFLFSNIFSTHFWNDKATDSECDRDRPRV